MRLALCNAHAKPKHITVYECGDGKYSVVAAYVVNDDADWTAENVEQARLLDPPPLPKESK